MWEFWEFIVSGRLPGSSIEINFEEWLYSMAGLLAVIFVVALARQLSRYRQRDSQQPGLAATMAGSGFGLTEPRLELTTAPSPSDGQTA